MVPATIILALSVLPDASALSLPLLARWYYGDERGLDRPAPLQQKRATLPAGWTAEGCVNESNQQRLLQGFAFSSRANTPLLCITECAKRGFTVAGTEFGDECYCAHGFSGTGGQTVADSYCTMPCPGASGETCGNAWYLNLYTYNTSAGELSCANGGGARPTTAVPTPTETETPLPTTEPTQPSTTVDPTTTTSSPPSDTAVPTESSTTPAQPPSSTVAPSPTSIPQASGPHYVWAHHMVGNTYTYSQNDWAADVSDAKTYGIDGFALNMGSDSWQTARIRDAYAAAEAAGSFKMFLSFDMTVMSCSSAQDADMLVNLVKAHASSSAQAQYEGRPLVSTFAGGDCTFGSGSTNGWQTAFVDKLNAAGINIFFVPSLFADPSTFSSLSWMHGELNWNSAWPQGDYDIGSASTDARYVAALGNKAYLTAVSPFFYTHFGQNTFNKNWLYRSDDWLYCSRWEEIIALRAQSSMTEILTWNDFGESSYIGPIKGSLPATSSPWVDGMDHTGLASLTNYYATAFKTGAYPAITEDSIIVWSRPHAADATASQDSVGRPTNYQCTNDNLYAVVLASAPATVKLTAGTNTQSFDVPAGLSKLKIASSPGAISGTVSRGGATTATYSSGDKFEYTNAPSVYNFNYFVGSS